LPVDDIANLGMELRGSTDYQLADGSVKQYLVFNTKIRWKGRAKRIEAILTFSEEILLGTKLFEKAKLIADYKTGKCQIEF
jgi:predicted aspartyl protease